MAKKVVASLQTGAKEYAKVIRMVKSSKSGAYAFQEDVIPESSVKEFLSKK